MRRGEVWWVNFDPAQGGESKKRRPAVIVSNDAFNTYANRLQVVPLTSNVERIYPSEALITLNGRPGKAMADQLTTVSKQRLGSKAGDLTAEEMDRIERAIRTQLDLAGPTR
jgi:mRNA interferase MazF